MLPLNVFGQNILYVDSENGSDAFSGTVSTVQSGHLGPKATIEGAVQAAGGEPAAIVLLSTSYDRDESGTLTPEGTPGGNDADGVRIKSQSDLILRITRDGETRIRAPLRIDMGAGNRLLLHGGEWRERTLSLERGFDLISGTVDETVLSMASTAAVRLGGTSYVRNGTEYRASSQTDLTGTLTVEPGGRAVFDELLTIRGQGLLVNGGTLRAGPIFPEQPRVSFEESSVYLHNLPTGDFAMASIHLQGFGIIRNEGTMLLEEGVLRIESYLHNQGTLEVRAQATLRGLDTSGAPDGGARFIVPSGGSLTVADAYFSRQATLVGTGVVVFDDLRVDGTFDFEGTVSFRGPTVFTEEARLISLGSQVRVFAPVTIERGASPVRVQTLILDEYKASASLNTEADITARVMQLNHTVKGAGNIYVEESLVVGDGRMEGSGSLTVGGDLRRSTTRSTATFVTERALRFAAGARVFLQHTALGGTGAWTIDDGAEVGFDQTLSLLEGASPIALTNYGILRNAATAPAVLPMAVTNRGVLDLGALQDGEPAARTLTPLGPLTLLPEGSIVGAGRLDTSTLNGRVAGTIAPGDAQDPSDTGVLIWEGAFAPKVGTEIRMHVAGPHDQLRIEGPATFKGDLTVDFPSESEPRFAGRYDLITYATHTGTFQSVDVRLPDRLAGATTRLIYGDTTLTMFLEGLNALPVATADTVSVSEKDSVRVDVLANDFDPDGDPVALLSVQDVNFHTTRIDDRGTPNDAADDGVWFVPRANYGTYVDFSYTIGDGHGGTAKANVRVEILQEDDPPYLTYRVLEGATVGVPYEYQVQGDDPDGYVGELVPEIIPAWLTREVGYTSQSLRGTPTEADIGAHPVRFIAVTLDDSVQIGYTIDVLPDLGMVPGHQDSVDSLQPVLDWDDQETAAYRLQLTTPGGFGRKATSHSRDLVDTLLTVSEFSVPDGYLHYNRYPFPYEWRIGLVDAQGKTRWTGVHTFTVKSPPAPSTPTVLAPADGDFVRLGDSLSWTESERAYRYRVEVDNWGGYQVGTSHRIHYLKGNQTYAWRVQALGDGGYSDWSPVSRFTVWPLSHVQDLAAEGPPGALQWADYDRDGDSDLLTTSSTQPFTQLYRNDGDDSSDGVVLVPMESGLPDLTGIAEWGNFDSDHRLDVLLIGVVGGAGSPVTDVYSWDGERFARREIDLPIVRDAGRWGDYDNDGDMDLVLSDRGRTGEAFTSILRNEGGVFTEAFPGRFDLGGSVEWEDYDYDGDLDLLVAGRTHAGAFVVRIYEQDAGTYSVADEIEAPVDPTAVWVDPFRTGPWHVMVHGERDGAPYSALYLNGSGGLRPSEIPFKGSVHAGEWGDFDADGDDDVLIYAVADGTATYTLYLNALGALDADQVDRETFTAVPLADDPAVQAVRAVWVNADGGRDLEVVTGGIVAGRPFLRMLKNQDGSFVNRGPDAPEYLNVADHTATTAVLSWRDGRDDTTPPGGLRYNVVVGTTPGGHEVVGGLRVPGKRTNAGNRTTFTIHGLDPDSTYYWRVQAVDRSGVGGDVSNEAAFTTRQFTVINDVSEGDVLAVGDANNDGTLDVLKDKALFLGTGFDFEATEHPALDAMVLRSARFADFDGDGDLEIVAAGDMGSETSQVLRIYDRVDLQYEVRWSSSVAYGVSVQVHDFDNDGDPDLLAGMPLPGIFWNEGGNVSDRPTRLPLIPGTEGYVRPAFYPADYDADGDVDLLVADAHVLAVMRNEGGTFTPADAGALPLKYGGSSTVWGNRLGFNAAWSDYDADGDLDLTLTGNVLGQSQTLGLRNEDGLFLSDRVFYPKSHGLTDLPWADADNDGDVDLAMFWANSLEVLANSDGEFDLTTAVMLQPSLGAFSWADIDGDFDADLVAGNGMLRNNVVQPNAPPEPPSQLSARVSETGDVVLEWAAGQDDTTPARQLSYAVRVGRSPGAVDVVYPNALTTGEHEGRRTTMGYGNAFHNTFFPLRELTPGHTYYWSVQSIDNSFAGGVFAEEQSFTIADPTGTAATRAPDAFGLDQNYPNPFNGTTHIRFALPETVPVRLDVFDIMGRRVASLADRTYPPGYYQVNWSVERIASGIYFYRLSAGRFTQVRRMVVAK